MQSGKRRSSLSYIPGLSNNAVLQIIIFSAVAYVVFGLIWAVIRIVYPDDHFFYFYFVPQLGLPPVSMFPAHCWTLLTYGWFLYPGKFWELASNMLWLYCFGSVVQMLIGHRQVIPLYIYSLFFGGLVFVASSLVPGLAPFPGGYFLGPAAGLMGMSAASITISPRYRFFFTETFSLPLAVIVGAFAILSILGTGFYFPSVMLLLGGSGAGFAYVRLLQAGYKPGNWMYGLTEGIEGLVTPSPRKGQSIPLGRRDAVLKKTLRGNDTTVSSSRIDDILDKINQKGYNSLTDEEKETLKRAGQGS
jgi:membrane associated rhomboid family serine protease